MSFLRSAVAILCISTFAFVSCSKDDEKPDNQINRTELIGKVWRTYSYEIKLDDKAYTVLVDSPKNKTTNYPILYQDWTFSENGTVTAKDEEGDEETSTWSLANNKLSIDYSIEDTELKVEAPISIEGNLLKYKLADNVDLNKKEDSFTASESLAALYLLQATLRDQLPVSQNTKRMSLTIIYKAK